MPYYEVTGSDNTTAFLSPGDDLPGQAAAAVPSTLIAFSGGNATLFAELESSFPTTYEALTDQCPPVQLLFRRFKRFTMMGDEKFDTLVSFIVQMDDRTLDVRIPPGEPLGERRLKRKGPKLDKLPAGFDAFYRIADAFGLTPTYADPRCDFPQATEDWMSLFDYATQAGHDPISAVDIAASLNVVAPFVFIRLQDGGLVVGDQHSTRQLLFVDLDRPDRSHVIDEPTAALDRYFARALLSPWGSVPWS